MFSRLVGNNKAKEFIMRLIAIGRVPNALLFAGPDGVGKREFALELARAFVCQSPAGVEGCGECSACKRVGVFALPTSEKGDDYDRVFRSEHADVGMVVPYKRNLRVGAIRDLEREANFRPYEAPARIFIIDDADKMNDAAANALLKTLEEPPATTFLILVTSRPDSLLQTIRSRCQIIRFAPVSTSEIETVLHATYKFTVEDAALAASVSAGSVGYALGMDVAQFRATRDAMLGVLQSALINGDVAAMLQTGEQMNDARNKDRYEQTIDILHTLVRDLFAVKNGSGAHSLINSDIAAELADLGREARSKILAAWIDEIELLRQGLNLNINRKVATDALFAKMASG